MLSGRQPAPATFRWTQWPPEDHPTTAETRYQPMAFLFLVIWSVRPPAARLHATRARRLHIRRGGRRGGATLFFYPRSYLYVTTSLLLPSRDCQLHCPSILSAIVKSDADAMKSRVRSSSIVIDNGKMSRHDAIPCIHCGNSGSPPRYG